MKVVQINTFSYKATGNIMMNLHKAMLEAGIESYVAWGRGRKAENNHEYFMNDDFGVKIHGIFTRITDKTGFASTASTKRLLDWIENVNPDIIHLHCIHGYYINIELLFDYIRRKKIKIIWTQHDCWAFTGHCAYFDAAGCNKWINGCYCCKQLKTYPASKILDNSKWNWEKKKELFSNLNMTLVTPCSWLANLIKKSFLNKYPIKVIYNGIDASLFKKTESNFKDQYKIGNRKIILGIASEWTERKGLKDFINLNEILDKEKYVIVIVGVTKKQMRTLPNDIIAINRTEDKYELARIYSGSDVYFNPTYEDNFPTTNLEAISCGTPVITYDTGGSAEAIADNTGVVIKKGDYARVPHILENRNFDNVFKNHISYKDMANNYLKLYYDIGEQGE